MEEDEDLSHNIYRAYAEEIAKSKLSNSEGFDKAILTLSSAGLALSISFIKFVVPLDKAISIDILENAWISFLVAIISTVLSFRTSQIALDVSLEHAEKYYLEGKAEYENKNNPAANLTELLNWLSGAAFIIAVSCIVYFVTTNV